MQTNEAVFLIGTVGNVIFLVIVLKMATIVGVLKTRIEQISYLCELSINEV